MQTFDVIFCFQVTHVINKINKTYNREGYGVECHFQQYFCYIIAVCFIGGGSKFALNYSMYVTQLIKKKKFTVYDVYLHYKQQL